MHNDTAPARQGQRFDHPGISSIVTLEPREGGRSDRLDPIAAITIEDIDLQHADPAAITELLHHLKELHAFIVCEDRHQDYRHHELEPCCSCRHHLPNRLEDPSLEVWVLHDTAGQPTERTEPWSWEDYQCAAHGGTRELCPWAEESARLREISAQEGMPF